MTKPLPRVLFRLFTCLLPLLWAIDSNAQVPSVTSVAVSDMLITDADLSGTFTIIVSYDSMMDTAVNPDISFPTENPTATLILPSGNWTNSQTFEVDNTQSHFLKTVDDIDQSPSLGYFDKFNFTYLGATIRLIFKQ